MSCTYHADAKGGGRKYSSYSFLTSVLDVEWSVLRSCCALPPEKNPGTQWIGNWVGLRASLDTESRGEKNNVISARRSNSGLPL
jgi:hypothetical protein